MLLGVILILGLLSAFLATVALIRWLNQGRRGGEK